MEEVINFDLFNHIMSKSDMTLEEKYSFLKLYIVSQQPKNILINKIKEIIYNQKYFYFKSKRLEFISETRPTFILTFNKEEIFKRADYKFDFYSNDRKLSNKNLVEKEPSIEDINYMSNIVLSYIIEPFSSYLSNFIMYDEVLKTASKFNLPIIDKQEYDELPLYIQTLFGMTFDFKDETVILEMMF